MDVTSLLGLFVVLLLLWYPGRFAYAVFSGNRFRAKDRTVAVGQATSAAFILVFARFLVPWDAPYPTAIWLVALGTTAVGVFGLVARWHTLDRTVDRPRIRAAGNLTGFALTAALLVLTL